MTEAEPQRPYIGAHLLLIKDHKLLLMKRTVKDSLDGMYALVAGKVDMHESPKKALAREAVEEAGIHVLSEDLEHVATIHHAEKNYKGQKNDIIEFYFVPKKLSGTPVIMEPDKASELDFFPLDNLPEPLTRSIRFALTALNGGPAFIEN
jgi:8-oxo-dGTP diphosphatase